MAPDVPGVPACSVIREAEERDLLRLQEIERAAGAAFAAIRMTAVAEDEPLPLAELARYAADHRAWVATDADDRAAAYLLVDVVDGAAHVEQVSVDPAYAGRGLGRSLLDRCSEWARERRLPWVTLTTFADVPWNAPYYVRIGFTVLADDDVGPELRAVRQHERDLGLDAWPRVCLRRAVGATSPPRPDPPPPTGS